MLVSLSELNVGQTGVVREVRGGPGMVRRLEGLGLRPGKTVVKLTAYLWAGPVLVRIDNRTIALGRGMAQRILVEAGP